MTGTLLRIKAVMKRPSTWAILISVMLLALVLNSISLPEGENVKVGIVTKESRMAQKIFRDLESTYSFIIYEDEEAMEKDVSTGKLECGFVFDEDFDHNVEKGRTKNQIDLVVSNYSTRASAVMETVYAAFLENYSEVLLREDFEKNFEGAVSDNEEALEYMLKQNRFYLEGNGIFTIDFK